MGRRLHVIADKLENNQIPGAPNFYWLTGYWYFGANSDIVNVFNPELVVEYPFKIMDDGAFFENGFCHDAQLMVPSYGQPFDLSKRFADDGRSTPPQKPFFPGLLRSCK